MEFYHYFFPSETFVVLSTDDQFVGRDDGPLEQQRQDSHVCRSRVRLWLNRRIVKYELRLPIFRF